MEQNNNLISINIKKYREKSGLSLSALAEQAQVSKAYLSQLESGKFNSPSAEVLFKIAGVLGVTIADLVGEITITTNEEVPLPPSLKQAMLDYPELVPYAKMLAAIKMRGKYPQSSLDWWRLFNVIENTIKP